MANQSFQTGSAAAAGFEVPGVVQIGSLALLGNIIGLWQWTAIALTVFAFCTITILFETLPATRPVIPEGAGESGAAVGGSFAMAAALVWALVGGVLSGGFGILNFSLAAWIAVGLFTLRTVVYLFGVFCEPPPLSSHYYFRRECPMACSPAITCQEVRRLKRKKREARGLR
jgi:hypothetical protein